MSNYPYRPEGPTSQKRMSVLKAHLNQPIVLVGLMGAGKSRLGRILAKSLDLPFYDCDTELEQSAGRTVAEIVAQIGEAAFHQAERRVLDRLMQQGQSVIATGGGADLTSAALPADFAAGAITLWVRASLDIMVNRTTRNMRQRPFLHGKDPRAILAAQMDLLYPHYERAMAVVESHEGPVGETLEQAFQALEACLIRPAAAV